MEKKSGYFWKSFTSTEFVKIKANEIFKKYYLINMPGAVSETISNERVYKHS